MYKEKITLEIEDDLIACLGLGVANAKKAKSLPFDTRVTRLIVASLRNKGFPICSGSEGYWIAESVEEIDGTISNLMSRQIKIDNRVEGLKNARRNLAEIHRSLGY